MQSVPSLPKTTLNLINMVAIPVAVGGLGKKVVSSLPIPAVIGGAVLTTLGLMGVDGLFAYEKLSERTQFLLSICTVALSILAMRYLTPPLEKWTGFMIDLKQATLIAGMAAALKTAFYFLLRPEVSSLEDAYSISSFHLSSVHEHFRNHPDQFQALDLRTQVAINKRFIEAASLPLPLSLTVHSEETFSEMTAEELRSLSHYLDLKTLNLTSRQNLVLALYQKDVFPERCDLMNYPFTLVDFASISVLIEKSVDNSRSPEKQGWVALVRKLEMEDLKERVADLQWRLQQEKSLVDSRGFTCLAISGFQSIGVCLLTGMPLTPPCWGSLGLTAGLVVTFLISQWRERKA